MQSNEPVISYFATAFTATSLSQLTRYQSLISRMFFVQGHQVSTIHKTPQYDSPSVADHRSLLWGPSTLSLHKFYSFQSAMNNGRVLSSPRQMDLERNVIVQVRERNAVLGAHRLSDDDLVDVVELIPVFISVKYHT